MRALALIRRSVGASAMPCPGGRSSRVLTQAGEVVAGFHVTDLSDTQRRHQWRPMGIYVGTGAFGELGLVGIVSPILRYRRGLHAAARDPDKYRQCARACNDNAFVRFMQRTSVRPG